MSTERVANICCGHAACQQEVNEVVAADRKRIVRHLEDTMRGKIHVVDIPDVLDAIEKIKVGR